MYFFKEKRLLLVFLVMVQTIMLFSQEGKSARDSLLIKGDTVITDTILTSQRKISSNALTTKVTYSAAGYIMNDLINRRVVLIKSAVVNYGEIQIKADSIIFNMNTNLLFAAGRPDTSGKIAGKPDFKEGSQQFTADELTYNFKTHKALIKNIVTKQDQGLLHSAYTKLLEDGTSNISRSTYSTCDLDTPHFYINLPRARVYPGKKIVSGPGNLVLEGIPLPLVIPFGYFPIETKRAASGIIFPRIGQENERGYSLTDGGYYFAISDYFDLALKGNVYSNGSWMLTTQSSYKKLYKYSGDLSFSYANNISGHLGLEDYSKVSNYRLGWTYSQDAKASPGSRFSASVNMSSSGFDKSNSYVVTDHVTTQRQSSVSYSKTWDGTPFNLSLSANQSQNVKTGDVSLDLPKANFNMSRIFPLKSRNSTGPSKWYQELQFSYSAQLDNKINTKDSLLFTSDVFTKMQNGFTHTAPISLQIRPFNNFSISPAITYTGVLYTQKINKIYDPGLKKVVIDTTKGVFYGQAFNPSFSASFNPQLFGTYQFTNPNSRVQAIRHVIKPSIGFSFVPALDGLSSKMYRQVQADSTGLRTQKYSIFEGGLFGTPSLASKSGNVSFNLVNILEAKVFDKNDTTGKPKKIKIIDNFSMGTSYNIFADSMRWTPVSMQLHTSLLNKINISANSSFSMYGMNSNGTTIGTFYYAQTKKLLRLTNFQTSFDFSLSDLLKGKKDNTKSGGVAAGQNSSMNQGSDLNSLSPGSDDLSQSDTGAGLYDEYGYPVFNVPWSMNVSYSLNYSKPGLKSTVTQGLIIRGSVSVTKKMSMTYSTGYDFTGKQITQTQIGITRDLHCWEMNFNWFPNGSMKMWNFTIRVKASVLGDLKYERRKDFHDSY